MIRFKAVPEGCCLAVWLGLLLVGASCSGLSEARLATRLVDEFDADRVENAPLQVQQPQPFDAWEFSPRENGAPSPGLSSGVWTAPHGVAGFRIDEQGLRGRTTSDFPLLVVTRDQGLESKDLIHSLEIRLRLSEGSNLSVAFFDQDLPPAEQLLSMAQFFPWWESVPVVAGESFQTYKLRFDLERPSAEARHIMLRPTDVSGADFEISSIRLISRHEHLARIPSGVGWHGFGDIFRESLVSRSPETIRFEVGLGDQPWLDLHVATVDHPPVTFVVAARPAGSDDVPTRLLRRTVTTPHRWEETSVDLSPWAEQRVELALQLQADEAGSIGFWGTPVVRSDAPPPASEPAPSTVAAGSRPPQGVIFILADTLRKDHLDAYGYRRKTAPLITEMASRGVRFNHSLVQATWTKVSASAILTSLYPTSHRVKDFADRISAAAITLAEVYRNAGYATLGFSSVPFTGKFTNLHQGFEELHESSSLSRQDSSKTAREYGDRLADWLSRHRNTPFFVFFHVFDPHDPFEPDRPWNTLWADAARRAEHKRVEEELRQHIDDPLLRLFGMPTRAELQRGKFDPDAFVNHNIDWYDGSIRGLDVEVARLMGHLQQLGLDENTLIVFTSDHGEEFLEHGRTFHGQSTYGELTQVPLILYQPSLLPEGVVVDEVTQSIDIMPTLLQISQLPVPDGAMGQSLLPLIEASHRAGAGAPASETLAVAESLGWERRPAITERPLTGGMASPPPRDTASLALVWDGWKLVHNTVRKGGAPEFELFKFPEDSLDRDNLAADHPEVVQSLVAKLAQWREQAEAGQLPESLPTEGLSKEDLERLRSLGYIK